MRPWDAVRRDATIPFLVAAVPVAWLAANEGGYFPEEWGGPTLVLLWVAMLALVLGRAQLPGRLSVAMLVAAATLTAWIGLSATWSTVPSQSVLELERALLYIAALVAALLLVHGHVDVVLGGVVTAIAFVCTYALAVRLFPHAFDVAERQPFQTAALFEPIGYSNALGTLAAVGIVLALGFSVEGRARSARSLAAGAVVVLSVVLFLAFSRGAWLALVAGLAVAVAFAPRRARLVRAWLVGPIPCGALGISLASHAHALLRLEPEFSKAALQGALLFAALTLFVVAAAATRFVRIPFGGRLPVAAALAIVLVAAVTFERDSPMRPATALGTERGASVAIGRRDELWGAAWNAFEERPLLGHGAGAFEQYWLEHRKRPQNARDAHNLYVEALGEIGVPGLALFVVLFGIPVAAGLLARARPLIPAALGGLAVYLAHVVVDWDWEVPTVTVAALFVAAVLVAARDEADEPLDLSPTLRAAGVAALLAASAFSVVALVANRAGAAAQDALRAGAAERAEADARRATRWAPWSAHPLRTLADAQLLQDERDAAKATIRKALAKEDRDWRLWLTLAIAAEGEERREAFERAETLNPLGRRIAELRPILGVR